MEVKLAKVEQKVDDLKELALGNSRKIDGLNEKLDNFLDKKADKAEFLYWRNVLVMGIGVSILLALVSLVADKFLR